MYGVLTVSWIPDGRVVDTRMSDGSHMPDGVIAHKIVATRPRTVKSLCSGVIPGSVMLTPHNTSKDL